MREQAYWIALSCLTPLGARRIRRLVEAFGSAENAYTAGRDDLIAAGLPLRAAETVCRERQAIDPDEAARKVQSCGISVLTLYDAGYPDLLRQIYDPPAVLFFRGDIGVLAAPCVAVVGSRQASVYGRTVAEKLAGGLAAAGVVVVSGMARGIDTCAHTGALKADGKTAAVLGCGLDICYPPENRRLREEIAQKGVIISEFPPGTQPKPAHFPLRNRIISGLSLATVVVEAGEKSGALITADCALEQGRDVFAVPGSVNSPNSRGCHRLIKEGAQIAESAADILQAMGMEAAKIRKEEVKVTVRQSGILDAMQYEPVHFDDICHRSGIAAQQLAADLAELELAGLVTKTRGSFYLRV